MDKKFDLIIIGGGAAAFAAAMKANELGAKALMVNNNAVGIGGTCVNVGCLPTKHLLHAGELINSANHHNFGGIKSAAERDFNKLIAEKDQLVSKLRQQKYANVLKNLKNVEFVEGNATFVSKNEVKVGDSVYKADKFIVATGSSTYIPPIQGIEKIDHFLTNIEALSLKDKPESMIVLGGGALGVEFAQMFARFGTKVCLLQSASRLVPREEPELAKLLQKYLEDEGIEICTSVKVESIRQKGKEKVTTATANGESKEYFGEELLIATGRNANTNGLNLEILGVKLGQRGEVLVNDEMQAADNVWAAGDVKGEPMLETVAAKEGMVAATNALAKRREEKKSMDYSVVPHAVFTDPQLAGVGLTDEEAIKSGIKCRCNTIPFELVPKAQAIKDTRGAIKMVIDNSTKKVIGVHILSPMAAELIHEATFIVKGGLTVYDVIDTLHVFPTMAEAIKIAAQSFTRDVSKMSCCVE